MSAPFIVNLPTDKRISKNGMISINLANVQYITCYSTDKTAVYFGKENATVIDMKYEDFIQQIKEYDKHKNI